MGVRLQDDFLGVAYPSSHGAIAHIWMSGNASSSSARHRSTSDFARVGSRKTLIHSYLKGPMAETYIVNEIIKSYKNNRKDAEASFYYFRTFDHSEVDLLINSEGRLTLAECKAGEEFKKKDIASFNLLQMTHYRLGKTPLCARRAPSIRLGVARMPFR